MLAHPPDIGNTPVEASLDRFNPSTDVGAAIAALFQDPGRRRVRLGR